MKANKKPAQQPNGPKTMNLTAAHDTVNHKLLSQKVYQITKDHTLTMFIACMLQNRCFFVQLRSKNSQWRRKKNGLTQGSVLAPILFNIYTNDQPASSYPRRFIYAADTAVAAQGNTFEEVEERLMKESRE